VLLGAVSVGLAVVQLVLAIVLVRLTRRRAENSRRMLDLIERRRLELDEERRRERHLRSISGGKR
jgi:uncharacterized membrane-anchored protein YhcB (DUF1043 family)